MLAAYSLEIEMGSVPIRDINLPSSPCVYLIRNSAGDVLYVGQSEDLNGGWKNDQKLSSLIGEPGLSLSYLEVPADSLYAVEKALISVFSPPLNDQKPAKGLSAVRRRAGLTQKELAERVGVTETTIRNWENNRSGAEWFDRVARLCETLQCQPKDLLELKD